MFQQTISAVLRGVGQLAFIGSSRGGLLFLLGLACISPVAASGALGGSLIATGFHRVSKIYQEHEWQLGISGYNAAVVVLLWSGMFVNGPRHLLWYLPFSILLCFSFEYLARRIAAKVLLPVLTLPAVLTIWITSTVFTHYGLNFWALGIAPVLNEGLIILGMLGILTAMSLVSISATVQAAILALLSGFLASWYFGLDFMAFSGLWGFTVLTASFGVQAIFFQGATSAAIAGMLAAFFGAVVWLLWTKSPLGPALPPLLFPFIVGTWGTLLLARKIDIANLTRPVRGFWAAVSRSRAS